MHRTSGPVAALTAGLAGLVLAGTVSATPARSGSSERARAANLKAALPLRSDGNTCVPPASVDSCATRTITGPFPGLGQVAGTYTYVVDHGRRRVPVASSRRLRTPSYSRSPRRGRSRSTLPRARNASKKSRSERSPRRSRSPAAPGSMRAPRAAARWSGSSGKTRAGGVSAVGLDPRPGPGP